MRERDWQLEVVTPDLNDQIQSLKAELAKLKKDCLIIKTDSTLGEFANEIIRMNGLYQNNKFTSAEALKNQLCEGLDNIMQTRLDEIKD